MGKLQFGNEIPGETQMGKLQFGNETLVGKTYLEPLFEN
nr:hypothetical protein pmam_240 [Pithovirus mammoth]